MTTTDPLKTVAYTLLFAITGTVIAVVVLLPFVFAAHRKSDTGKESEVPAPGETEMPANSDTGKESEVPATPTTPGERVPRPWDLITDERDREIVRLWQDGHMAKEIAHKLSCREHTVENRISALRKQYGEEIVPLRRKSKRRDSKRNF